MRFTASRAALRPAIAAAATAASRDNKALDILRTLLIDATAGEVRITGSDMVHSCTAAAAATIDRPGAACVDAHIFDRFVGGLPAGADVAVSIDGGVMLVTSGRTHVRLSILPADAFPLMEMGADGQSIAVSAADLSAILAVAAPAAESPTGPHWFLAGVHLEIAGDALTAVATDRRRLHTATAKLSAATDPLNITVGAESIAKIAKLIKSAGEVVIRASGAMVEVDTGGAIYRSKLIDEKFQDGWRRILGIKHRYTLRVDRPALVEIIDRVMLTLDTERPSAIISPSEGFVEFICHNPANGAVVRDMLSAEVDGETCAISVNALHLAEAIKAISGETITISVAPVQTNPPGQILVSGGTPDTYAAVSPYGAMTAHDLAALDAAKSRAIAESA